MLLMKEDRWLLRKVKACSGEFQHWLVMEDVDEKIIWKSSQKDWSEMW